MPDQTLSAEDFMKGTTAPAPVTVKPVAVAAKLPNGQVLTQPDLDRLHPVIRKKILDKFGYEVDENGEPLSNASEGFGGFIHKLAHDTDPINVATKFGRDFGKSVDKQGGWGLDEKLRQQLGADNPNGSPITQPLHDLPVNALDLGYRGLQSVMAGLDAIPRVFLPDSVADDPVIGAMAIGEGGGAKTIDLGPVKSALSSGKVADIVKAYTDAGSPVDVAKVKAFVKARDAGVKVSTTPEIIKSANLPEGVSVRDAANAIDETQGLQRDAAAFKGTPEPKPTDVFPTDASRAADAKALQDKLEMDAKTFMQGRPVDESTPAQPDPHVQELVPAEAGAEPVSYDGPVQTETLSEVPTLNKKGASAELAAASANPKPATVKEFGDQMAADAKAFTDAKAAADPSSAPAPVPEARPAETPPPEVDMDVVDRLTTALKNARSLRPTQDALYSADRAQRIAKIKALPATLTGKERYYAKLSILKGELKKADFPAIEDQFKPEEISGLFNTIDGANTLSDFGKLNAQTALQKLLSGKIPTPSELSYLSDVFPADFVKAAVKNKTKLQKIGSIPANLAATARAMKATLDLSFPFTQGWAMIGHPEFYKAFAPMIKQWFKGLDNTPKGFDTFMADLKTDPMYSKLKDAGVYFSDKAHGEEPFAAGYAHLIPGFNRLHNASEAAYSAFANKVRLDIGKKFFDNAKKAGVDVNDPGFQKSLAMAINSLSGRGNLGRFEPAAGVAATALFSPRFIASRINLLNPKYYYDLDPAVRKEVIKSVAAAGAISVTVAMIAKAAGANVTTDPKSSDFGKVVVGKTRYSVFGGFNNYATLAARIYNNQTTNTAGVTRDLGKKYGDMTRFDVAADFATNKSAPLPGYVLRYWKGKNPDHTPFNPATEGAKLFVPMFPQDTYDVMQQEGVPKGLLMSIPGLFGVGMNTYQDPAPSKTQFSKGSEVVPTQEPQSPAPVGSVSKVAPVDAAPARSDVKPVTDSGKAVAGKPMTFENSIATSVLEDGLGLRITDNGIRSMAEQTRDYMKYKGVAKPGHSDHEVGNAIDVSPSESVSPLDIVEKLTKEGFYGIEVITKKHGSGPHWHVQWEGIK